MTPTAVRHSGVHALGPQRTAIDDRRAAPAGRQQFVLALALLLALAVAAIATGVSGSPTTPARPAAGAIRGARSPWAELPPVARLAVSRGLGRDEAAYWGRRDGSSVVLSNAAQRLSATAATTGVAIASGRERLRLSLVGAGRATPSLQHNLVRYRRGAVTEWYANGPLGIEQGFRIARPLNAPLRLRIGGSLRARLQRGGRSLDLIGARGATVLRYGGLRVTDARGRALAAHLTLHGHDVEIGFAAAHARYPLTVDPLVQAAKLSSSDGYAGEKIAGAVAMSGNTIAVGAPSATVTNGSSTNLQGAVYVFTAPGGNWALATQAELVASNPDPGGNSTPNVYGDSLGTSVAMDGGTIVAGAYRASENIQGTETAFVGAAYVFQKPAGGWQNATQSAELTAPANAQQYDDVGSSVAVSGTTVAVGALNVGSADQHSVGKIYVYSQPAGGWGTGATLTSPAVLTDSATTGSLGFSLAAGGGNTIVAGAPYATVASHSQQGKVVIYTEPAGGWGSTTTPTATLTRASGAAQDWFGYSVGISDATVVAGAPHMSSGGSLFVFNRPGAAWTDSSTPAATLTASDHAGLGSSVGISGATIVAGSEYLSTTPNHDQGALYVFGEPVGGWTTGTESQKLTAADPTSPDLELGASVAVSGPALVGGAPLANAGGHNNAGAAFVFAAGSGTSTTSSSTSSATTATFTQVTTKSISQTATSTAPFIPLPLNVPIGGVIACAGNSCTINIGCPQSTAPQCAGSISVGNNVGGNAEDLGSAARASHKQTHRRRPVVLASGRFAIRRDHNGRVRLALTRTGRADLKKHRSIKTSFVETITKPHHRTIRGRITLRRAGR